MWARKCLCSRAFYLLLPSALWQCWLGVRKSIRPLKKLSNQMAWLSVWSEMQMIYIWSSWCHCHPIISCFTKIQIGLTFLLPALPGCPRKDVLSGRLSVLAWLKTCILEDVSRESFVWDVNLMSKGSLCRNVFIKLGPDFWNFLGWS